MAAIAEDITKSVHAHEQRVQSLQAIVQRLQAEADMRVGQKAAIEQRWLEDVRQFNGQYDEKIEHDLRSARKSTLFINLTRAKTNAMEARLSDMLFPTDDRNWGIYPTPIPELVVEAERAARKIAEAKRLAAQRPDDPTVQDYVSAMEQEMAVLEERRNLARERARAMEEEIDDHLRECGYAAQARDVIRDACRLGTGIMKGPITDGRTRRTWEAVIDESSGTPIYQLRHVDDGMPRPVYWRVDPWSFFPDMDASCVEDCESFFERHLFNRKQLRRLGTQRGFDKGAIQRLLRVGPQGALPSYLNDLRAIGQSVIAQANDRYIVWEYHGPLTVEDLQHLAAYYGREELLEDIDPELEPLEEVQAVVWFCQGEVLKFALHHLDSEEPIYSVFNLEKDESSLFGYGVPYIMRDPQKALSAAWRTVMDNMGLSSGPQIVINDDTIEPANGEWVLEPRKLWKRKAGAAADKRPFEVYNIESRLDELLKVIEVCRRNIDEETALPMLAQGEQGAQVTKTFQGMAILMNSVNVVFRRIVKNFDDDVTTPNMRRIYDWLMQFSPKEHIKGDYQVDARGTSVLLVREMQSQNLMAFLSNFSGHPLLGKYLKDSGLPALRALAKTLLLSADEIIKSDAEIAEDEAREREMPPPPNPEMEKIAAMLNKAQLEAENRLDLAYIERETAMIELAARANVDLDKLITMVRDKALERAHRERMFAAEAAIEARRAANQKGSGGYF